MPISWKLQKICSFQENVLKNIIILLFEKFNFPHFNFFLPKVKLGPFTKK